MNLYEKYRPMSFADVVGQDKVLAKLDKLRPRGLAGRAYWLSGVSGVGKTTIGRLIAAEVASEWSIEEIDATGLTAGRVREIEQQSATYGMGSKSGRAYIVNEAHGLTVGAVRKLLTALERIPPHVVWVFTTSVEGQKMLFEGLDDAHPLLSRCIELSLAQRGLGGTPARNGQPCKPGPFALLAQKIAIAEGMNGQPIEKYVALLQCHRNNLRAAIQSIESGDMLTR